MQILSSIYYKVIYWIFSVHRNKDVFEYIEQNIFNKVTKMNLSYLGWHLRTKSFLGCIVILVQLKIYIQRLRTTALWRIKLWNIYKAVNACCYISDSTFRLIGTEVSCRSCLTAHVDSVVFYWCYDSYYINLFTVMWYVSYLRESSGNSRPKYHQLWWCYFACRMHMNRTL